MKRLISSQDGGIAVLFGLLLLPVIAGVGLAIDTSRAESVKLRLQESLDAAALVGAKNYDSPDRNQKILSFFDANWVEGYNNTEPPIVTISADAAEETVTVNAKVKMNTTFMKIFGYGQLEIGTAATSIKGQDSLEVAFAIDNTVSMGQSVGGFRKIDTAAIAAKVFVNQLHSVGGALQDSVDGLWISIVPFTSMVNIGSQHTEFLVPGSTNNLVWDFPKDSTSQNSWRGCVFERSFSSDPNSPYHGNDMTDVSPAVEAFFPYYVPPAHFEMHTECRNAAPEPPPSGPPDLPPCDGDGSCLKRSPLFQPVAMLDIPGYNFARDYTKVSGSCRDADGIGVANAWYNLVRLYQPVYTYVTPQGLTFQYTPRGGGEPSGFNALSPLTWNNSAIPSRNVSGVSKCCDGGVFSNDLVGPDDIGWTNAGRWIAPWSSYGKVKLGGWGNSGCGIPLLPLTNNRLALIEKIEEMDVPAPPSVGSPPLGYNGTLINQGLVWAWRTISGRWRGFWEYENGTAIPSEVPYLTANSNSAKAVVVLTDGLNFLEDPWAWRCALPGCGEYFRTQGLPLTFSDPNLTGDPNLTKNPTNITLRWDAVDSSAYGIINRDTASNLPVGTTGLDKDLSFCRLRQATGSEPHLNVWGCRLHECMLRVGGTGECAKSGIVYGVDHSVQSALTGPYYDELTRRLLVTCDRMRADKIRIFFVLFDVASNPQKESALAALKSCVGSSGGVYDTADEVALTLALNEIAVKIQQLRLIK